MGGYEEIFRHGSALCVLSHRRKEERGRAGREKERARGRERERRTMQILQQIGTFLSVKALAIDISSRISYFPNQSVVTIVN